MLFALWPCCTPDQGSTSGLDSGAARSDGSTVADAMPSMDGRSAGGGDAADAARDGSSGGADGSTSDASTAAAPEVLYALAGANVSQIHVDAERVYWEHGAFVYQAAKDGTGAPVMLGNADGGAGNRYADDATHIYWLSRDRIVRVPKSGRAAQEWLLGESFVFGAWALGADFVYLTNAFASALWRMPKGGGALEVVAEPLNTAGDRGGAVRLSLHGDDVFVGYLGDVFRVRLPSGEVSTIATGTGQVSNVVRVSDAFYWVVGHAQDGLDVVRFRDGGTSEAIAHLDASALTGSLVADDARLYFFPTTFSALTSFELARGTFEALTLAVWSSRYLALDADFLYWTQTDLEAPAVMRTRKPR